MNKNKILKFISLILIILFFSYLNSQKTLTEENKKNSKEGTKEGFTDNIREYYNKNKRDVRDKIEDFKIKGNNKMNIQVIIKNVYGNQLIYPKCDISKAFSNIAKTKTLSIENLKTISQMGYQVEVVNENNIKDLLK